MGRTYIYGDKVSEIWRNTNARKTNKCGKSGKIGEVIQAF